MAGFGGIVVADPLLANQFTQGELRALKTQFEALDAGRTGIASSGELEAGFEKLSLQPTLSAEKVAATARKRSSDANGGLDFESFLWMYLDLQKDGSPSRSPTKATSAFLKDATTILLHTISHSEKKAYVEHINTYLAEDPLLKEKLPIDPLTDYLFEIVRDGILLSKLINVAVPGTIDERALNLKDNLNPWEKVENQTLCLNSAKAIGCSVVNIGTEDLAAGRPHLVLGLISQIVKIQLLADLNLKRTPELVEILLDSEEIESLTRLTPEKVLLRWMNFHLRKAGYTRAITNFSADVKDGEAYTVLLHALAPESCDLAPLKLKDPKERAKALLVQAEHINCRRYVSHKDILDGCANLNLAFVANLFHERNGLVAENSKFSYAEMLEDDEQDSREERAYRMWINSLGIGTYVHSLFEDVVDGWVLLEVLDKVAPGVVNWRRANRPPFKIPLKKVENCNQAIEIGKNLKLSLVNVAGPDIVQKNKKLILAYLWQLMRCNVLQLLKNLKLHMKEVADGDILHWANAKVKSVGKSTNMESFKDKNLSNGLFFLDLLGAVEPRVVNWHIVTPGLTELDKKQNANYIISVARKLGCSIFLLWDDIVEVVPCFGPWLEVGLWSF
eukprot:TRINITY_DN258_c0_g1_i1.p1 TRINITY_DN258_c0_g1~~TRINITY_DN258_c0_g1_i1.p1  ORF type:complete len:618 (+),score=124.56 TRINITY_DN258_c0_g1_i1:166-2019(+)